MEPTDSSKEVVVCLTCGDKGFTNAFVYCVKCLGFVIHRYCLDVIPRTPDEFIPWFCEDCEPAVPYKFTSLKLETSCSEKEDATSSAHVKSTHPKKKQKNKQKKRKIASLLKGEDDIGCPEKATEPDHECIPPTNFSLEEASVKSEAGYKQISPCVVSQMEEGVCQKQASEFARSEDNCSTLKGSAKRKRNETSLAAKAKEYRTQRACTKKVDSIEQSRFDSSCTTATLKNNQGTACSVQEQRCDMQQSQAGHEKLVSDSSSIEKELDEKTKDHDGQAETANQMHNEQDVSATKTADASQSADVENNVQYIHYQPGRPVLDPVWRGSFNITQTDYDLLEGFAGHLSTKACYRVCEEATMLPSLLCLEMHPKTALWPKSFLPSGPSDENIALYFFPGDAKNERAFDRLVIDMIDEGLAMRATAKNAELLIFTSTVLPKSYSRFQGKYYLWGVFRGKRKDSPAPVNQDLVVSNNSNNHGTSENYPEVTSEKKIRSRVKILDAPSPQSPLCNTGDRGMDMDRESED